MATKVADVGAGHTISTDHVAQTLVACNLIWSILGNSQVDEKPLGSLVESTNLSAVCLGLSLSVCIPLSGIQGDPRWKV